VPKHIFVFIVIMNGIVLSSFVRAPVDCNNMQYHADKVKYETK